MWPFKNKKENREDASTQTESELDVLLRAAVSGRTITVDEARAIPSLNAGVSLIAGIVASLPVKLYKEDGKQTVEVLGDNRVSLLNDDTKDLLTGMDLKKNLITDYFYSGSAYAFVRHTGNEVKSIHYLEPDIVSAQVGTDKVYKEAYFLVDARKFYEYEVLRVLRKTTDGVTGSGIVEELNLMLSTVLASLKYESGLVQKGGNKRGFIEAERKLSPDAMTAIRDAWRNLYANDTDNVVVLNDGAKFKEASNTAVEMQLEENKTSNNNMALQLLGVNPYVLNGVCTDQQFRIFINTSIMPLLRMLESSFNKYLLLESEKSSYYFAFDTKELLKGDILTRYQAYKVALDGGFIQPDEVRYIEDLKPLELDFLKLSQTDVLYNPKTKDIYNCNANAMANMNNPTGNLAEGGGNNEN